MLSRDRNGLFFPERSSFYRSLFSGKCTFSDRKQGASLKLERRNAEASNLLYVVHGQATVFKGTGPVPFKPVACLFSLLGEG